MRVSVPFGTDTLPTGTPPAVLETKLVTRRRLPEQMIQASDPITKINTPSGFGKTILLSQCAAALAHAIAWVSLDDVDDDPTVLLTEIATAVDRIASVDPAIFVHLPSPEPAIGAEVVPRQLTSLAQAPQRALLLDDVHLVRGAPSARALALLGEHLPATVRVILATLGRLNALPCDPVLERADSAETLADYRRECCPGTAISAARCCVPTWHVSNQALKVNSTCARRVGTRSTAMQPRRSKTRSWVALGIARPICWRRTSAPVSTAGVRRQFGAG